MTQVIRRRDPVAVIADNHTRIRRIEATPASGGGSGGDCPDCVLDPFTVNPDDIFVPEIYRECISASAGSFEWGSVCGFSDVGLGSANAGKCGLYHLGYRLQIRGQIFFDAFGQAENFQVFPYGALAIWGFPSNAPLYFDSGWITIDDGYCGVSCNDEISVNATFNAPNSGFGNCTAGGAAYWRWVKVNDVGLYRGALDELPQGDAFGDTLHFNSVSHEWVTGPRSVPSRAISAFMGGR